MMTLEGTRVHLGWLSRVMPESGVLEVDYTDFASETFFVPPSIIATLANQFHVYRRGAYRVRRMYLESETSAGAKHTSEP